MLRVTHHLLSMSAMFVNDAQTSVGVFVFVERCLLVSKKTLLKK